MKLNEKGQRKYGCWAGNPNGNLENPDRCVHDIWTNELVDHGHQCFNKRGYGKGGLYCKRHAKKQY